jgi:hypothetical protein
MSDKIKQIKKEEEVVMSLAYDGKIVHIKDRMDVLYHRAELRMLKKQLLKLPSIHSVVRALDDLDVAHNLLVERDNG